MKCNKCGSENVRVEVVNEQELKKKKHGWKYWLLFGWLGDIFLWMFFFLPRLIFMLFRPKRYKMENKQKSVAICQECGHRQDIKNGKAA